MNRHADHYYDTHAPHYTADSYGNVAVPDRSSWPGYATALPVVLGEGRVRELAREVATGIIEAAQTSAYPVVWITSNAYMPPMRDITAAEYVWNAANNDDGELWAWFTELVEDNLSAANVALECPEWDNALYAVDLARWQYREDADDTEDLNDEWEPRDPDAVDGNGENPRE